MSNLNQDEILNAVNYQLQQAESYYSGILESNFQEAYYIYESDPAYYQQRFPILSRMIGDIQTADVASKVEWSMPSLLKIFLGSDAIVTITGRHPQDVENAQKMQKLINWQITTQNDGFMTFYKWFKDALITGVGYLKAYWDRVYEDIKQKEIIDIALLDTYKNNPNISNVQVVKDFGNGLLEISYTIKQLKRNQPVLEHIPVWELLYVPDGHSLSECSFIAHRKTVTGDYLRRMAKQGIYKNVEEAIEGGSGQRFLSQLEYLKDPMKRFGIQSYAGKQDAGKQIVLYECYTKYDINDDGLLENVIITIAGNNILRIQENIYSRPPFFMISPLPDIHRIGGRGFSQMVGNYQHIKTALVRQSLLTIALGNVPKLLVDPASVYLEDLEQNKLYIRQKPTGNPQPVKPIYTVASMTGAAFNFLEYIETQIENESGITRYNQGLQADSLNKTATGIQMIMGASNQRLEMVARIFAETGIKELMRFLIELNQLFIDQRMVVKLLDTELEIDPSDLEGNFDLEINTGVGLVQKETTIQTLQQVLQLQTQLMQIGIVTPQNLYNTAKKLLEELGYKNTSEFLTDPSLLMNGGMYGQGAVLQPGTQGASGEGLLQLLTGGIQANQGDALQQMAGVGQYGMAGNQGGTGLT